MVAAISTSGEVIVKWHIVGFLWCTPGCGWRYDGYSMNRLLAIRLQALGDMIICLPYLQGLKQANPGLTIDFLTRAEQSSIPEQLSMFRKVWRLHGGRKNLAQRAAAVVLLPRLLMQKYDAVLDLQNNHITSWVCNRIAPAKTVRFDTSSKVPHGSRCASAVRELGLPDAGAVFEIPLRHIDQSAQLLKAHGWSGSPLVCINPAGFFKTRHWPESYYSGFASKWKERYPHHQFLFVGLASLHQRIGGLLEAFPDSVDLCGLTSPVQAYQVIRQCRLMLSEDSGLMHMAWTQGVPTVALFGSTPSYWSRPLGDHAVCLDSSDLSCGDCFAETCARGDMLCLTRRSPEEVLRVCETLLDRASQKGLIALESST